MNTNNNINFKGIYYVDAPVYAREAFVLNNPLINNNPPKWVKEAVENSKMFKDLGAGTDVFVASHIDKKKKPFFGVIKALCKDPYHPRQQQMDEINIEATGFSEEVVQEKLKQTAKDLPYYKELKDNTPVGNIITLVKKDSSIQGLELPDYLVGLFKNGERSERKGYIFVGHD